MGCRDSKGECCHPERQCDPKECTPEQIRECHGEAMEHCCEGKAAEQK